MPDFCKNILETIISLFLELHQMTSIRAQLGCHFNKCHINNLPYLKKKKYELQASTFGSLHYFFLHLFTKITMETKDL